MTAAPPHLRAVEPGERQEALAEQTSRSVIAVVNRLGVVVFMADSAERAAKWIEGEAGRRGPLHIEEITTTTAVSRRRVALLRGLQSQAQP